MKILSYTFPSLQKLFALSTLAAITGLAQAQSVSTPASMIVQPIDRGNMVTLKGNVHPLAVAANDRGAAPDSLPLERMVLLLNRPADRQQALLQLVDDQQNSKSPSYHKWLTPAQFGASFGLADKDLSTIASWLESYGFKVEDVSPGRNFISFSGTHAQLKNAFHTEIHQYLVNGTAYWANNSDPEVPAALATAVQGFLSLNNFPRHSQHTPPKQVRRNTSTGRWEPTTAARNIKPLFTTPDGNGGTIFAIGPADFGSIYNVQPLWNSGIDGTGQTIALVADSDINPADVDYFRSVFGLPAKNLNIIYNGPDPGLGPDETEADIDTQWAGAVAPNATIDLVVSGDTNVAAGIDLSALYIINNNLAPIMSESFGVCELALGTGGNQFYDELWRQAAAQGITAMVSSGDAGSAGCDQNVEAAQFGLAVNGIASTPYNTAIGGTDLYGTFLAPNKYWSSTNNASTLESALSYIPELPWNNSCGNPQALPVLQSLGFADATEEAECNDPNLLTSVVDTAGGSGGVSSCTVSTVSANGAFTCASGYAKPSWQSGIPGIPDDQARDIPDVALMAGSGLWGSSYVFCQSDSFADGVCDVNNAFQGAGGTSFGSPAFAGLVALIEQKTQTQQGNINYTLYKLGATQYTNSSLASSCLSENVVGGNACFFYDVDQGSNAVPCFSGSVDCTPTVATDQFAVLPAYAAQAGFDLTTGLGTLNAYNLVQGWSGALSTFLPSDATLSAPNGTTLAYGTALNVTVAVTAVAPATGTPSGDFSIISNSTTPGTQSVAGETLSGGHAMLPLQDLPAGSYQLSAHYAGDATFAPSNSPTLTINVNRATSTASLSSSRSTVLPGQAVSLFLSASASGNGVSPTGTATFTDTTTGQSLGTVTISSFDNTGSPIANGFVTLPMGTLGIGNHIIAATYSGDGNYLGSNANTISITVAEPFSLGVNPAMLNLKAATPGGNVLMAAVTSNGNATLNAASLNFSCSGALPPGLACSFSTPVVQANGSVASTLTLQLSAPLVQQQVAAAASHNAGGLNKRSFPRGVPEVAGLLLLLLARRRRVLPNVLGGVALLLATGLMLSGCSGGVAPHPAPALTATVTTLQASTLSPALNSMVTFTASVAPDAGGSTPTGPVSFNSGATTLGTAQLVNGTATYSTSSLPIGSQSIVAQYAGDATHASSTSLSSTVDVTFTAPITVTAQDNAGHSSSASVAVTIN